MALAAVALTGCPKAARPKGMETAHSTAAMLAEPLEARRWALVIGVDAYDDPALGRLRHAADDAGSLAAVLGDHGAFDHVTTLVGHDQTTRDAVVRALKEVRADARRRDTVVVYFSGHGTRLQADDGWHRYLLLADSTAADVAGTGLDLAVLQEWLTSVEAGQKALIVDACFDGDGKSALVGATVSDALGALPPSREPVIGEAQLYATTAGRPAREDDRLGHGVYTWYLLDALSTHFDDADIDRDGVVTAWEAHDHARGQTMEHTGDVQIPEATFRLVGDADLVLVGDVAGRKARQQALLYQYGRGELASATIDVDGRDRGAFPATVPLQAGRHHVVLTTDDGRGDVAGFATFQPGQAWSADDLARVLRGPSALIGARPVGMLATGMSAAIGSGGPGVELWGIGRADGGPLHGVFGELDLGGGVSPSRRVDGDPRAAARSMWWADASIGWQRDLRRFRVRAGAGGGVVWIPPSALRARTLPTEPTGIPSEAGWLVGTFGPTVGLGYTWTRGWTVSANLRAHGSLVDGDGDGGASFVPWLAPALGVEVAL